MGGDSDIAPLIHHFNLLGRAFSASQPDVRFRGDTVKNSPELKNSIEWP
jgi:hypothetical protein